MTSARGSVTKTEIEIGIAITESIAEPIVDELIVDESVVDEPVVTSLHVIGLHVIRGTEKRLE